MTAALKESSEVEGEFEEEEEEQDKKAWDEILEMSERDEEKNGAG